MNIGNCDFANTGEVFEIAEGEQEVCPKCKSTMLVEAKGGIEIKKICIIAATILIVAGIGYGIYAMVSGLGDSKIKGIKLDKKELKLKVGERELITVNIEPKDAKATFVWESSDNTIVSVVDGEITALRKGNATITVKVEEKSEMHSVTCKVVVEEDSKEPQPTETLINTISISSGDLSLKVGGSKQLSYIVDPQENDENISWSSSDTNVVSVVSETGLIEAQKEGTATITATSDKSMKQASVKITVTKKNTGVEPPRGRYHGTLSLGYGNYSGDILNGKPDGAGVLTYKGKGHQKAGRNFKTGEDVYAESGERVDGTWNNGYLSSGTLFKRDGNAIKIKN